MPFGFSAKDVEIHRIVELEGRFRPARDVMPGLTQEVLEQNREWLYPHALDADDYLMMCFQAFLVKTPHHNILIDSCIGNDKNRPAHPDWNLKSDGRFLASLKEAGCFPQDIHFVLCTHLHPDHVGWNTRNEKGVWVPTFPNARYVFSKKEYEYWSQKHAETELPAFGDSVLPIVEAKKAELVSSDHALGDYIRLLPTPGHTPDHVAVAIGRQETNAVVSGDLIHTPLQTMYPELSFRFDIDMEVAAKTRRSFLESFSETNAVCCMSHFPSSSLGRIKRRGSAFACELITA